MYNPEKIAAMGPSGKDFFKNFFYETWEENAQTQVEMDTIGILLQQPSASMTPERIARLPRYALEFILQMPLPYIESKFPGYLDGKYFLQAYEKNPLAWIPDHKLNDDILFAGEHNLEGLQNKLFSELELLQNNFPYPAGHHENGESFSIDPIREALGIQSGMLRTEVRRTGEPWIAHQIRTTLRAIDMIYEYNKLAASGIIGLLVSPKVAEYMLMAAVLHDFSEDQFKRKREQLLPEEYARLRQEDLDFHSVNPHLKLVEQGNVRQILSTDDTKSRLEMRRRLHWIDENEKDPQRQIKHSRTIESVELPSDPFRGAYLIQALKAVDSSNIKNPGAHLLNSIFQSSREISLYSNTQKILELFPAVVKIADRQDNHPTHGHRTSKTYPGYYTPTSAEQMLTKVRESLQMFPGIEESITAAIISNKSGSISSMLGIELPLYLAKTFQLLRTTIPQKLPTREAKLILFGLTPAQRLQNRAERSGLPYCI